jgi:hypothetical protein
MISSESLKSRIWRSRQLRGVPYGHVTSMRCLKLLVYMLAIGSLYSSMMKITRQNEE